MIHFKKNDKDEWVHQVNSRFGQLLNLKARDGVLVQLEEMIEALPPPRERHCLAFTLADRRAIAVALKPLINGHDSVGTIVDLAPVPDVQWWALCEWLSINTAFLASWRGARYRFETIQATDNQPDAETGAPGTGVRQDFSVILKE